jgi:hypothetical protein
MTPARTIEARSDMRICEYVLAISGMKVRCMRDIGIHHCAGMRVHQEISIRSASFVLVEGEGEGHGSAWMGRELDGIDE